MTSEGWRILLPVCCALGLAGCGGTSIFPPIGTGLANPLAVAVDSANARAYVVNSNNKVLYTGGSLHVVNIATPASPVRVASAALDSFSGKLSLDAVARQVYIANRLSQDSSGTSDHLIRVDVNEAGGSFLATTKFDADADPFGAVFYATRNLLLVPARAGKLDFYDLSTTPSLRGLDLKQSLSDGSTLTTADVTDIAIIGTQAVITRASGGLLVVNLSELGASGVNPVDYYITGLGSPRGVATDGTVVFVTNVETANGVESPALVVLNLASLAPDAGNTSTTVKDKDKDGLVVTSFAVGANPQQVVVGTTEGFVSNLGANTVTVFNLAARTKTTDIAVGTEPFGMAIYNQGGGAVNTHLLVCNVQSNTVSIIDLATRTVVGTYQ